jgi:hypothetical protein
MGEEKTFQADKKKATKMAILSPSLLVIALNVNELNTPIKTSFG